jgi:hypothetical protein
LVRTDAARVPGVERRVGVAAFFVLVPRFATVAGRAGVTFVGAFRAVVVLAAVVFFAVVVLAVVVFLAAVFFAGSVLSAAVLRAGLAFVAGAVPAAAVDLAGFAAALAAVFVAPPLGAVVFFAAARGAAGFFVACFATAILSVSSRKGYGLLSHRHLARAANSWD